MLASKFFELRPEGRELLLHDIRPDLGHILPDQPEFVLEVPKHSSISGSKGVENHAPSRLIGTGGARTRVAAAFCKPAIPGRRLMILPPSARSSTRIPGGGTPSGGEGWMAARRVDGGADGGAGDSPT